MAHRTDSLTLRFATALCAVTLAASGCAFPSFEAAPTELAQLEAAHTAPAGTSLTATTHDADVHVVGVAGMQEVSVQAWLWSDEGVRLSHHEHTASFRVELVEDKPGVLRLDVMGPPASSGLRVDVVVLAPADLTLDLLDDGGMVRIEGIHHAFVDDGSGDLSIDGLTGDLDVLDMGGDLTVTGVAQDVFIEDGSGDILLQHTGGHARVVDGSGDIEVLGVGGRLELDDGSGDMTVTDVAGGVTIIDGTGDIEMTDVAEHRIVEDTSGEVTTG